MTIIDQTKIKSKLSNSSPNSVNATFKQATENLWENLLEATEAMKKAVKSIKNKFNFNEKWDGDFYL